MPVLIDREAGSRTLITRSSKHCRLWKLECHNQIFLVNSPPPPTVSVKAMSRLQSRESSFCWVTHQSINSPMGHFQLNLFLDQLIPSRSTRLRTRHKSDHDRSLLLKTSQIYWLRLIGIKFVMKVSLVFFTLSECVKLVSAQVVRFIY